jgi:flagellar biosynthetic protein FliQ
MSSEMTMTVMREALQLIQVMLLVTLVPALVVGLLVSLFQAATQINEMTLSFIPKLLVTLVVFSLGGPWLIHLMTDYMRRLIENIPYLIG